ncbi:phosphoribosyl-ATP pyrophosphatase [Achromatium sp. WMS1]|nr:phosphoribosyl-ATP pyrophosphatase [Achromatium sp. WMS1]
MSDILHRLEAVIEQRKQANSEHSYVARLYAQGLDKILKKIAEETAEVLLAAKDNDPQHLRQEMADLWFHCLVLLAKQNLRLEEIFLELQQRFGRSGLKS